MEEAQSTSTSSPPTTETSLSTPQTPHKQLKKGVSPLLAITNIPMTPPKSPRVPKANVRRICENCLVTTTPMWRSGPSGPGTLCNACSLRWKAGKLIMPEGPPKTKEQRMKQEEIRRFKEDPNHFRSSLNTPISPGMKSSNPHSIFSSSSGFGTGLFDDSDSSTTSSVKKRKRKRNTPSGAVIVKDTSMWHLIWRMENHSASWPFRRGAEESHPSDFENYSNIITNPINLDTIAENLTVGKYWSSIHSFKPSLITPEFERDIRLIFTNCFTFFKEDSKIYELGKVLQSFFENELIKFKTRSTRSNEDHSYIDSPLTSPSSPDKYKSQQSPIKNGRLDTNGSKPNEFIYYPNKKLQSFYLHEPKSQFFNSTIIINEQESKVPPFTARHRFLLVMKIQQLSSFDYQSAIEIIQKEIEWNKDKDLIVDIETLSKDTIELLWKLVLVNVPI